MKARIIPKKFGHGWILTVVFSNGKTEYPQEYRERNTREEILNDARVMYADKVWGWDEEKHTIDC